MNILFLSRTEQDLHMGGIAEVILQLSNVLPSLGVKVFVFTAGKLNTTQPIDALSNGTPCYSAPLIKPGFKGIFLHRKVMRPLIELTKNLKIDIVHTCGLYRAGYAAMYLKKMTNIPYVITSHGDILGNSSDRIHKKSVQRRCKNILKEANAVTHLTRELAQAAQQIYDTTNKSTLIPNGVNFADWSQVADIPENNYIFAIGRLVKEKGFDVLISAFAEVLKRVSTSLIIAGSGPYETELRIKAQQHRIHIVDLSPLDLQQIPPKSLCFVGNVQGNIKKELFCRSQLVLFPTQPHLTEEAFGLVPFEAFAAKKSLIMSKLQRATQLQKQGFKFEIIENSTDENSWARRIIYLLENKVIRNKFIHNNFTLLAQFDWSYIAKQYQRVYQKVLEEDFL